MNYSFGFNKNSQPQYRKFSEKFRQGQVCLRHPRLEYEFNATLRKASVTVSPLTMHA